MPSSESSSLGETGTAVTTSDIVAIVRHASSAWRRLDRRLRAIEADSTPASPRYHSVSELDVAALLEQAVERFAAASEARFDSEVIEPLIRRAIPAIDLLTDGVAGDSGDQAAILGAQCELLELLAGYGVESLRARPGAAFDPRWMRPEQVRSTSHQCHHMTVAAMTRLGFRRDQRVLRPATVVILKYKEPSSHDRSY